MDEVLNKCGLVCEGTHKHYAGNVPLREADIMSESLAEALARTLMTPPTKGEDLLYLAEVYSVNDMEAAFAATSSSSSKRGRDGEEDVNAPPGS